MRTTVDLDGPILRELKRLQKVEGKSLGRLVSDLLAQAMAARRVRRTGAPAFHWISRAMKPRLDLADKEALHEALDSDIDIDREGSRP
jgi:hypothetical protein